MFPTRKATDVFFAVDFDRPGFACYGLADIEGIVKAIGGFEYIVRSGS